MAALTRRMHGLSFISAAWFAVFCFFQPAYADGEKRNSALVLVIDGFNTCGYSSDGIYDPSRGRIVTTLKEFQRQLGEKGISDVKIVTACYGMQARSKLAVLSSIMLCFDGFRGQISGAEECHDFPEPFSDEIIRSLAYNKLPGPVQELLNLFEYEIRHAKPNTDVYIVGHSYGGWTAERILKNLKTKIKGFVTVDGISPYFCSPAEYLASPIYAPRGCKTAPWDTAFHRRKMREKTGRWDNFFQNDFYWLHSSAIPEADHNEQFSYQPISRSRLPHGVIFIDPKVWERIVAMMTETDAPLQTKK